jgi:hypothetical protein
MGQPELADQSNVSPVGDVLVQTTIYRYGLRFTRAGGDVYVERVPAGGQINLGANAQWLNNLFDMWSTFDAPNV